MHPLATPHQAKHALAPAVYAARACELASANDPSAGDDEVRWAIEHASLAGREVARRLPARSASRSRLDVLLNQLDAGLRRAGPTPNHVLL